MESLAGDGGMIPEQVWDADDIPERGLFMGRPSGSAMPLAWAHAEYLKLRRSLQDGRIFDRPPQTVRRYLEQKVGSRLRDLAVRPPPPRDLAGRDAAGRGSEPAVVHWSTDGWKTSHESATRDTGLGIHVADLDTAQTDSRGRDRVHVSLVGPTRRWDGGRTSHAIAAIQRPREGRYEHTTEGPRSSSSPGHRPASAARRPGRSPGGGRTSACWPGAARAWKARAGTSRRWEAGRSSCRPTSPTPAQVEAAAAAVEEAFGPIDVWVNNAMVSVFSPVKQMEPEEYRRVTEVTYLGTVYGTLAALRRMLPRDRGAIVQVGSALAYRGIPLQSAYCAAKHAIQGFCDSLHCELIHDKSRVRLTMVQMPALNTPQFGWVKSRLPRKAQPVPPIFQPEVAAEAIVWAAHHDRRSLMVGWPTVEAIVGNKIAPGLLDAYLARTCFDAQMTGEPEDPARPDNLWEPVDAEPDHGAHGIVRPPVARLRAGSSGRT